MNRNDAVKFIVKKYLNMHNILAADFARKCEVSKPFISKIINSIQGKFGISSAYIQKLAKGMNISVSEFEDMIAEYLSTGTIISIENRFIIGEIRIELFRFNEEELKTLHSIIKKTNSNNLKRLEKNME